jgi:hypothetical protein
MRGFFFGFFTEGRGFREAVTAEALRRCSEEPYGSLLWKGGLGRICCGYGLLAPEAEANPPCPPFPKGENNPELRPFDSGPGVIRRLRAHGLWK